MSIKCLQCGDLNDNPAKFCIHCGEQLPIEAVFTDLRLRLLTRQELRIGEFSVFDCEVLNDSCLPVTNVSLSLSSSVFVRKSECTVDLLESAAGERIELEVEADSEKKGTVLLYMALRGLVDGKIPLCYKGQTRINAAQPVIKRDSDQKKINIVVGNDAIFDRIVVNAGDPDEAPAPQVTEEWVTIPLKRDPSSERDWFEQIRAKSLRECPYCSCKIDVRAGRCEFCSATMPSWFSKRQEALHEFRHSPPPPSRVELTIPSLNNKVFRFYVNSRIRFGRHSTNDISTLFYDESGALDRDKSLAISNEAGELIVDGGRANLLNINRFGAQFTTRHTSESIEIQQNERIELKQGGTLTFSDTCSLDISLFTSQRQKDMRTSVLDAQEEKLSQVNSPPALERQKQRSSCIIWPERHVEAVRICRTDSPANEEHILLQNSASIGSGENCCVQIPKSGVQKVHARIIRYADSIWFENCSGAPLKFETGSTTRHLKNDAIMKVEADCTVKFEYLETHLKFRREARMEEL